MNVRLPFGEFKPDQTIAGEFLRQCRNVLASGDGRYVPLKALQAFSEALDEPFAGGYSAISSDGDGYLLVGTSTALVRLSGGTWSDLATGLATTYRWQFQQFGDYVVGVNGGTTQEVDLAAGTAADLATAPTGKSVWVVGDYVCIGQADGEINKVATSAFRDHTAWTPGTDQATEQVFQTGGAVQGAIGGEYGVIFQRERIVRQERTGDPVAPFQYAEITTNYGCSNGNTIASAGRTGFFLSDRGFMAIDDGQALRAIGNERVDRFWEENVGRDAYDQVFCAIDPRNSIVVWGLAGINGFLLVYNFALDRWTTARMAFSGILAGFDTSTSLEALAVTYADLDALTISLDDARWQGGDPRLYLFTSDDEAGTLTGDNLEAVFELPQVEVTKGRRSVVRQVVPMTDATDGLTVSLAVRQRSGDAASTATTTDMLANGYMPIRTAGKFIAPTVTIAAGTDWTYVQGLELVMSAGGRE
ncbi:hypothetical protein [Alteraurantiacibacter buctensis]|uniref:Uncharacterized protein n=1 Tax=Alteraurantiacibacter buctensis TaxID=1503981 RepID=A0A844Z1K6_9SPHN|nr:hypothetical protein [Alteraurantiacibacter buctensis]MXO72871.1 hypothetical protein [Alteraurantiacibacter buctensis]